MSQPKPATFSPLSDAEQAWISEQLAAARTFAGSESVTPEQLDQAFSRWIVQAGDDSDNVNAVINAVGVQFGQFLVDSAGFQWVIASDAYGTDLAVVALPGQADVLIYPANFVAKRWERREAGFIANALREISAQVRSVQAQPAQPARRPWWRFGK